MAIEQSGKQLVGIYHKPLFVRRVQAIFLGGLIITAMNALTPAQALDSRLRMNVYPANITFNIMNPDPLPVYYQASQQVTVVTHHTYRRSVRCWYVGVRTDSAFLTETANSGYHIPISCLRWSKDGINFYELKESWQLLNSYQDQGRRAHTENITYRLYPDQLYTAGQYSVQINFDARWTTLPWN